MMAVYAGTYAGNAGNNFLLECHVVTTSDSTHVLAQFSAAVRVWSVKVQHLLEGGVYLYHFLFTCAVYSTAATI